MKRFLLFIAFAAIFITCKKDPSSSNDVSIGSDKPQSSPVTATVSGMITDENDHPVAGAQVIIAGHMYTTNTDGIYKTSPVALDKYISTVKVIMPGYFTVSHCFSATTSHNYVDIKLIPKALAGTFTASSNGEINLPNGSSISFQPNSIKMQSNGTAYAGQVNVYASYIDPTSTANGSMIGAMGEDANKLYVVSHIGAMAVELESTAGESLQLIAEKPASMKLFIPASLQSKAPETINTWSMDSRGVWQKESMGTKAGNLYQLDVTHFSFWSGSIPATPVFLTMNFHNQDGVPLNYAAIQLAADQNGPTPFSAGGYTDETGTLTGMVPANMPIHYFTGVYGTCLANQETGDIGPYADDATENFVFNIDPAQAANITGTALDCSGNPVTNGSAEIYIHMDNLNGGGLFRVVNVVNGNYTCYFPICIPVISFDVVVVDNNTAQQSATISFPFSNVLNTGTINVCGVSTNQYINYSLDGVNYDVSSSSPTALFSAYTPSPAGLYTLISAGDNPAAHNLSLRIRANNTGTFDVPTYDSIRVNNIWALNLPGATATISTFPAVGQFYEGNFDVPFVDAGVNHTLTGTFRVKRDY